MQIGVLELRVSPAEPPLGFARRPTCSKRRAVRPGRGSDRIEPRLDLRRDLDSWIVGQGCRQLQSSFFGTNAATDVSAQSARIQDLTCQT